MNNNITLQLEGLLKEKFNINLKDLPENIKDLHMLDFNFGMQPQDLIYLLLYIEEKWKIKIPEDKIVKGEFSSFNKISGLIYNLIES